MKVTKGQILVLSSTTIHLAVSIMAVFSSRRKQTINKGNNHSLPEAPSLDSCSYQDVSGCYVGLPLGMI